ncbi:MAG TPA: roadblock/LC7 domain-containing protein [Candidatus Polarisedimenticolaceae bacterium]|nr:roadblock/LC7 domain-containing protein [Candidatus Polarisedimenticolaceae bacterium]
MLDEILSDLRRRLPGARAALLVDGDGMLVAGGGESGSTWELIGAATADLVRRSAAAHREAGLDPAAELSWGGGWGTLLYRAVTPEYGLLLALAADAEAGRARWLLRGAAARVLREL